MGAEAAVVLCFMSANYFYMHLFFNVTKRRQIKNKMVNE